MNFIHSTVTPIKSSILKSIRTNNLLVPARLFLQGFSDWPVEIAYTYLKTMCNGTNTIKENIPIGTQNESISKRN